MGIEARGSETLRQLRSRSDWPQSPKWENGRYSSVPRKALAHAAVTVLAAPATWKPICREHDSAGLCFSRWTTIPSRGPVRSSKARVPSPAWEIILHGYFWPSQDRRSIPGVTEEIGNPAGDDGMRVSLESDAMRRIAASFATKRPRQRGSRSRRVRKVEAAGRGRQLGHAQEPLGLGPATALAPANRCSRRGSMESAGGEYVPRSVHPEMEVWRREPFAGGSWPPAAYARAMSCSLTTMPPALQMNSTTGPMIALNAC